MPLQLDPCVGPRSFFPWQSLLSATTRRTRVVAAFSDACRRYTRCTGWNLIGWVVRADGSRERMMKAIGLGARHLAVSCALAQRPLGNANYDAGAGAAAAQVRTALPS